MLSFDLHLHTNFSPDSKASMEEMTESAISKNMTHIAFTDHCDLGQNLKVPFWQIYDAAAIKRKIVDIRASRNDICILYGIELGQAAEEKETAIKILSDNQYDFVIGSLHSLANGFDFYNGVYLADNYRFSILEVYLKELLQMVEWGHFDTLAHMTYPLRYMRTDTCPVSLFAHEPLVKKIFTALIDTNKAYELNTNDLSPETYQEELKLLALYASLGGTLVTIGSDAHRPEDVAKSYTLSEQLLQEAGIQNITIFQNRVPSFVH